MSYENGDTIFDSLISNLPYVLDSVYQHTHTAPVLIVVLIESFTLFFDNSIEVNRFCSLLLKVLNAIKKIHSHYCQLLAASLHRIFI